MAEPRPYSNIRIIDLTRELGAYCTRLFADLGADVIRIEPPQGRSDRRQPSPLVGGEGGQFGGVPFAFLNVNKKSVTIDPAAPGAAAVFADLIASSDIVVYEAGHGQDYELANVLAIPGRRVVTTVSYFGLDGPYAAFEGSDLIAQALGGIAWLTGEPGKPPLRLAGDQSVFVTSLYAAAATAIALWHSEVEGESHLIDVSAQECIAHSLQNAIQVFDLEGRVFSRGGVGTRDATENAFRCADGYVFLAAPLALSASWSALLNWMRDEGFDGFATLSEDRWKDRPTRATLPAHGEFRTLFERFVANKSKAELRAVALQRKVVMAPVSRIADLQLDPQLLFRKFFLPIDVPTLGRKVVFPGPPYRLSEPLWRLDRAAPRIGEDNDGTLEAAAISRPAGR